MQRRLRGDCTPQLFKISTNNWRCFNSENYLKADNCYKIITCDPIDDTIDLFVSTMMGVAQLHAKNSYKEADWRLFFDSLRFCLEFEHSIFKKLNATERFNHCRQMVETVKKLEVQMSEDLELPTEIDEETTGKPRFSTAGLNFVHERSSSVQMEDSEGPFLPVLHCLVILITEL